MFVCRILKNWRHVYQATDNNVIKHVRGFSSMSNSENDKDIVWIDMEMTGLDIFKDHILEVACVITDDKLNIKSSPFSQIIHQSDEILNGMNDWCKDHHGKSGLTQEVQKSKVSIEKTEQLLLDFLKKHNIPERKCPLGGNSVYMDRLFMNKFMPNVNEYLHYRIIDVSTLKELASRWNSRVAQNSPEKKGNHRAIDDIIESINELKYLKDNFCVTEN